MHLNPYGEYAVLLAASLADDWPGDRAGIEARTREFGMTMTFPVAPDDHPRTRRVVDDWLAVVDATDPEERARRLNAQMAAAAAYPRLTDHDDEGWHLHYRDEDQSLPRVLHAVISVGTALHLTTRGMHRLHRCAAGEEPGDPCAAVVVDVTRNGRQRYCSVRCANRAAVRRHRARARHQPVGHGRGA
ncbi:CGNR zinc finger protein [Isoptericola sp. CG 20/1183]|uniref:CGNR zinc finger protein n=1 Tax=Isoptericola halotolerans TaxID=300560 RepID=A0ABX5EKS8_9MICO|nr:MULTISPECIES: CGNR zinc finger domain-containing protein [Isoptericola]MCK0116071.1 CGNR zinc finger domain-containing protein [Isoptericola sp. S6320L]PRZ08751.1 CGNR zinc finger protein [Isoptericola halotolerans]PRZ10802.1 CGNR zinc finger protein [Isoptericola sp. CG 20/1183]